ncbi:ATP-dependent DNA helicase RecG [Patescibacteria group bacterium]|nr:ATP-dependent DNA helicase RecG [Patescibacteria group bacterium]
MTIKDLQVELDDLKGIGPKTKERLAKNNLKTVKDLLFFFPYRYEDLTTIRPIQDLIVEEKNVIIGQVKNLKIFRASRRGLTIVQGQVEDKTGSIKVVWFNQPYIINNLKSKDRFLFWGKVSENKFGPYFNNPKFHRLELDFKFEPKIIPIYSETDERPSKLIQKIIDLILKKYNLDQLDDPLPQSVRSDISLIDLGQAIKVSHQPQSLTELKKAQDRLVFEQLFYIQLNLIRERKKLSFESAPAIKPRPELIQTFLNQFKFNLTAGQKKALKDILTDINQTRPMNRLLQGETGSGKTILAEIAALATIANGYQVIMMAPTEILAKQHFQRFLKDFSQMDINLGLIVSKEACLGLKGFRSTKTKEVIFRLIHQKKADLIIGTHALIESKTPFPRMGLVIIDEQQRFGINQRKKLLGLASPNFFPHFLTMSATPIPRTLFLSFYSDLDLSTIKEMPKERKLVKTFLLKPNDRTKMIEFIKTQLRLGHQTFFVCPRIEATENSEIKSVKEEFEKIKKEFNQFKVELLHGKMKSEEKNKIIRKLGSAEIQSLMSESVIEVGLDLPQATVIVIEGAERFGLAQLHQLRGRVGRSIHQSYCFLAPQNYSSLISRRLQAIVDSNDALELAEKDLEIRGPGELLGQNQSGLPDLAMEALKNIELVEKAKKTAETIINDDPNLNNYPNLKKELGKMNFRFWSN